MSDKNKQHQGEPVAFLVHGPSGCMGAYLKDPTHWAHGYRVEPLYTHADPGEVERLRRRMLACEEIAENNAKACAEALTKLAERDTLLCEVLVGLWPSTPLAIKINAALSASAEPSAPAHKKCSILKDCNVRYSNSSQGYVDPNRVDQGGLPSTSAPVEIDERAAFEKHYASKHDGFCPSAFDGEYDWHDAQPCWEAWQARAALERKQQKTPQ